MHRFKNDKKLIKSAISVSIDFTKKRFIFIKLPYCQQFQNLKVRKHTILEILQSYKKRNGKKKLDESLFQILLTTSQKTRVFLLRNFFAHKVLILLGSLGLGRFSVKSKMQFGKIKKMS